ncbi:MAG: TIM barrel protein, partial [Acidimicrobiia bacterium]
MTTLRFGISHLPSDEDGDDDAFLDGLVNQGHRALELPFTQGFPWKESRCQAFGALAAERDIRLSVHAPYFVGLTIPEEDKGQQSAHALEHTMKLGKWLGAPVIVAHLGSTYDEDPTVLMDRIRSRIDFIGPKIESLGVGLGLETAGKRSQFGSLGDIAQLAEEYTFVRPVVDWAHIHAMTNGGLTSKEAFASVLRFVRDSFPGWMISPLQVQFSDNQFGDAGEIRHCPYGEGTLRVGPLVEAVEETVMSMVLISEAREMKSHQLIWDEVSEVLAAGIGPERGRPLARAETDFPSPVRIVEEGERFVPQEVD